MNRTLTYVKEGFGFASRRLHLVVLDMAAKLTWLALAIAVFGFAGVWFASGVELTGSDIMALESGVPAVAAAGILQSIISNWPILVETFAIAIVICFGGWVLLEAFVRGGLLPLSDRTFVTDAVHHFQRYLWVGLIRRTILGSGLVLTALITLGPLLTIPVGEWGQIWPDVRWAALAGLGVLVLLAFCLMTLETLIRSDAVEVLGLDLSRVVGIVLALALLETAAVLTVAVASAVAIQVVGSVGGLVVGGALLAGVLSVNHSYMLLVRYSAVGIMRRDMRYGATTEHASDL